MAQLFSEKIAISLSFATLPTKLELSTNASPGNCGGAVVHGQRPGPA
jgi:hypothetical protein